MASPATPGLTDQQVRMMEAQRQRDLTIQAYGIVFGIDDGARSGAQQLVIEDMTQRGYLRIPTRHLRQDGGNDDRRSNENEGARIYLLDIMEKIHHAALQSRGTSTKQITRNRKKFPVTT